MYIPDGYSDPVALLARVKTESEHDFVHRGATRALELFHDMAERVPAYKDFLKKHGVDPSRIKTVEDFSHIPLTDKDNYLRAYPLKDLCWDGELGNGRYSISTTSGSTGEPFYFPRDKSEISQYAILAEMYLRDNFQIQDKTTLYIDAFPMGPWIGGVFTYEAVREVAERGEYGLSIITTGINKQQIIKAVQKFGDDFDQIIIGCYGPFLKDTIDDGIAQGVDWKQYNLGFVFSAEAFSETFRDYILEKTGTDQILRGTLNHYGTVDLGTMAHETPLAIMLRRQALEHEGLYSFLFNDVHKLPTFCQYIPELFYFEDLDGSLVCSAYSGLPLVRYDLKDHGGVLSYEDIEAHLRVGGKSMKELATAAGIADTVWHLPFVYVYERSDFSVSLYAFQIYPETIRKAVQYREFHDHVTGKFSMLVTFDEEQNQQFEVHVELKGGARETQVLKDGLQKKMIEHLLRENSEYAETYSHKKKRVAPHIFFWPYEDPTHFRPGIKQTWVKK